MRHVIFTLREVGTQRTNLQWKQMRAWANKHAVLVADFRSSHHAPDAKKMSRTMLQFDILRSCCCRTVSSSGILRAFADPIRHRGREHDSRTLMKPHTCRIVQLMVYVLHLQLNWHSHRDPHSATTKIVPLPPMSPSNPTQQQPHLPHPNPRPRSLKAHKTKHSWYLNLLVPKGSKSLRIAPWVAARSLPEYVDPFGVVRLFDRA